MKYKKGYWWPDHDFRYSPVRQVQDCEVALKYVKKFDCCVQAGGNVGVWPKYLAKKFKQVHTFEPARENFECLEINVKEDNIKIYNKGLSNIEELIGLTLIKGFEDYSVAYQVSKDLPDFKSLKEAIALDSLNLEPDLIYLDINGYEYFALIGAKTTIMRSHPVIAYEESPLAQEYNAGDIGEYLKELGYRRVEKINRDVIYTHG